jgi:hypothetical protein
MKKRRHTTQLIFLEEQREGGVGCVWRVKTIDIESPKYIA